MCRLIGAISSSKIDAPDLIHKSAQSLLRQSDFDRRRKQGDGWGVGFFEGGAPRIIKSPRPMYRDRARVRRAGSTAKGKTLIAHVRWASNPLKLARAALIGPAHTQPFTHRGWIFAHNGTLFIPKEVAAELGPWEKYIKGKNDSEVLFYWFLKHLASAKHPAAAIRRSLKGLARIWNGCRKSYPIHRYPYHGLNFVLTNGQKLLAFCYTDPSGFGKSKALMDRHECYYQLKRKVTPDGLIVSSEPLDRTSGWTGFRHGELVIAKRAGNKVFWRAIKVL